MSVISTPKNTLDRASRFREIADRICKIANRYDVSVKGYHSPVLPLFSSLSEEKQNDVLGQLSVFLSSLETTESTGGRLDNQERSLWGALSAFGLIPPADMFNQFKSDDVIEIYSTDGIQIWRNFNFMKICSYTLEEVYSIEWYHRYKRDPAEMAKECELKIGNLLSGLTPDIYCLNISEHILEETLSSERYILASSHDWAARLKDTHSKLAAWIVVSSVKIIGKKLHQTEQKPKLRLVDPSPELSV